MWKWIKENGFKAASFLFLGYIAHIFIETFILQNLLALFSWKIPVVIAA